MTARDARRLAPLQWAWSVGRWGSIAVVLLLSALVAVVALVKYAAYDPQADTSTTVNFSRHPWAIVFHAVGASCAPLFGVLQFSRRLRRRWPAVHRWLGRIYVVAGAGIGGCAALWLSFFAYGGPVVQVGMGVVAVLWVAFSVRAWHAIRRGDVAAHQRWMVRSVALALGGVTLRIYLPSLVAADVSFLNAYRVAAWSSWVPNLLIAEAWLFWKRTRP